MGIPEYTAEDFLNGTEPYEYIVSIEDKFEREQAINLLSIQAKKIDSSINFKKHLNNYLESTGQRYDNVTDFAEQPLELRIGQNYEANDNGVKLLSKQGSSVVCMHPIMPCARLINVDTGEYGMQIAYRHERRNWQTIAVPCEQVASSSKIVELANRDISVTSDTAKHLSKYLMNVQELNYNELPEQMSVGRLGWVGSDEFIPYSGDYILENEMNYKQMFESIHNHGSATEWYDAVKDIRSAKDSVIPRIVLASSLASVLVQPCGSLPFVVHLWGRTGAGKTLALMLAASVWADPKNGGFVHTFNATAVGMERIASFLHNLPMLLDELQTISKRGDFEDIMYQLTEGVGRSRGSKDSALQTTGHWANSVITTGEEPITKQNSGGGTINRIIEISCADTNLFEDGNTLANILSNNYGYLGEEFVNLLCRPEIMEIAKSRQQIFRDKIYAEKPSVTEKQALSASLILTADYIATKYIFEDDNAIAVDDIVPYLSDNAAADKNLRACDWLFGWISENTAHFITDNTRVDEIRTTVYGKRMEDNRIAIIRSVFNKNCNEEGFDPTSFARWLKDYQYSECTGPRLDKSVRIGADIAQCIVLKLPVFEDADESEVVPW